VTRRSVTRRRIIQRIRPGFERAHEVTERREQPERRISGEADRRKEIQVDLADHYQRRSSECTPTCYHSQLSGVENDLHEQESGVAGWQAFTEMLATVAPTGDFPLGRSVEAAAQYIDAVRGAVLPALVQIDWPDGRTGECVFTEIGWSYREAESEPIMTRPVP
jgi:hypothetical protein